MVDINQKRSNRLRFLNELYERADGCRSHYVDFIDLGQHLGFDVAEVVSIIQYLHGEHLVETTSGAVALSHYGIKEVEQARTRPEEPTEHFPPAVNIIHVQSMVGSVIQQGGQVTTQVVHFDLAESDTMRHFVAEIHGALANLRLSEDQMKELHSDLATIESQLSSPRVKPGIIRETLSSVRNVLEGAAGSAVAAGLLAKFPEISKLWL